MVRRQRCLECVVLFGLIAAGLVYPFKAVGDDDRASVLTLKHKCWYCKAGIAAEKLQELPGFGRRPLQAQQMRVFVVSDERTNTVVVSGGADQVAMARAMIDKLDVPSGRPELRAPPILKTYKVPGGRSEAIAKRLQAKYPDSPTIRIAAVGDASIIVYASAQDQRRVAAHISAVRRR
jgi:hypothetical protein